MSEKKEEKKEEKKDGKLTLKYWAGRGLMEVPRQMLAVAGKFPPEDYNDVRLTTEEPQEGDGRSSYSEHKDTLKKNLGRVPTLTHNGETIGQSAAINYYVATECGLMGSTTMEGAQILAICEHLKELMLSFRKLIPYGSTPTKEQLDNWFNKGADDIEGAAKGEGRSQRWLKWFTGRIESIVGADGYAVGDKITLADVAIYNLYFDHLTKDTSASGKPIGPFASKERTDKFLKSHPKISKIIATVAANDGIKKWLGMRGKQGF